MSALPPPNPGDAAWIPHPKGDRMQLVYVGGRWVLAPLAPFIPLAPPAVERLLHGPHRIVLDQGSDGVRRWDRWWCSCGAYGFDWPTTHGRDDGLHTS